MLRFVSRSTVRPSFIVSAPVFDPRRDLHGSAPSNASQDTPKGYLISPRDWARPSRIGYYFPVVFSSLPPTFTYWSHTAHDVETPRSPLELWIPKEWGHLHMRDAGPAGPHIWNPHCLGCTVASTPCMIWIAKATARTLGWAQRPPQILRRCSRTTNGQLSEGKCRHHVNQEHPTPSREECDRTTYSNRWNDWSG